MKLTDAEQQELSVFTGSFILIMIEKGRFVRIENMDARTVPVEEHEHGFWED